MGKYKNVTTVDSNDVELQYLTNEELKKIKRKTDRRKKDLQKICTQRRDMVLKLLNIDVDMEVFFKICQNREVSPDKFLEELYIQSQEYAAELLKERNHSKEIVSARKEMQDYYSDISDDTAQMVKKIAEEIIKSDRYKPEHILMATFLHEGKGYSFEKICNEYCELVGGISSTTARKKYTEIIYTLQQYNESAIEIPEYPDCSSSDVPITRIEEDIDANIAEIDGIIK